MTEVWTKQCRWKDCHNYIPDNWELCNFHLREKYNLLDKGVYSPTDCWSEFRLYPEDVVYEALRRAEANDH